MELVKMQDMNSYVEGFLQFTKNAPGGDIAWLRGARQEAIGRFSKLGFPTVRDEDWRFTNLAPVARTEFTLDSGMNNHLALGDIRRFSISDVEARLVFLNGRIVPALSSLGSLPSGVRISGLAEALAGGDRDLIQAHLAKYADAERDAFLALNTAFMEDGGFIYIPQGAALEEPIHLLYLSRGQADSALMTNPRNLVIAGDGSEAVVVEQYASLDESVYLSNAVTEVVVGAGAVVSHLMIERESKRAYNVSTLRIQQGRASSFTSNSVLLGGSIVRNNIHPVLEGEGAECYINGLFMPSGRQHMDNYMKVEHKSPRCDSRQLYKGVLNGRSRGVFHGRIIVHKDAQKTDAKQTNRNLLLSDEAKIDTKPQLEIYADDVKCTHGATIGQLDENALFYLRSRALSLNDARALLLHAFTGEVVSRIKSEPARGYVDALVSDWFVAGNLIAKSG
ncbi:MAG: Fe-S cluster assembly protein SufD [Deltaproteobacteria bacterium]